MERGTCAEYVKFKNVLAHLGVFYSLGWMPTAFREMILETVFVAEGVEAVCTDIGLISRLRPAKYETRKTFD